MKNYITIAALLVAGTTLVNAESVNTSTLISNIQSELNSNGYKVGDSFEISFTIDALGYSGNSANIIGLGLGEFTGNNEAAIRIQSSSGLTNAYLGIRENGTEAWYSTQATWDETTKTNTLTFGTVTPLWMTMGENATQKANNLTGAKLTFSYDGIEDVSTISVVDASGITNVVNYTDCTWDATKLSSKYNNTTWNDLSVTVTAVPEPSAFGLLAGVGALAFVASRRRRK